MNLLLACGIGALLWLSIMLLVTSKFAPIPARRGLAMVFLRDAIVWPLAALRFAVFLIQAIPEALAEHRKEQDAK